MKSHLQSLVVAEERIQQTINNILKNNKSEEFNKLPGLIESLKIIKEMNK